MVDGFWTVKFHGPRGDGGGVVVFTKGKIFGGDSGVTYSGAYEENNNQVKAKVSVQNFIPGVPNVMGISGNFELEFSGTVAGNAMNVVANLVGQPAAKLNATLSKKSDLP